MHCSSSMSLHSIDSFELSYSSALGIVVVRSTIVCSLQAKQQNFTIVTLVGSCCLVCKAKAGTVWKGQWDVVTATRLLWSCSSVQQLL